MSRYHSYLKTAVQILEQYCGDEPFSFFQKRFFASDKKYGSRDRKQISHLCYCYFRLGKALRDISAEEKILTGLFLSSTEPNEVLETFKPEWNKKVNSPIMEKSSMLITCLQDKEVQFSMSNVFPWEEELSAEVNYLKFRESFLVQPDLFLRLRPGYENSVKEKLTGKGIGFKEKNPACLILSNASRIDDVIELNKEAVVQDYNSQRIAAFLPEEIKKSGNPSVWDCCAGSGGKSLLLYDINPSVDLAVSDVRDSILINLRKRFTEAGIKKYNSFKADLNRAQLMIHHSPFDLIICDAPCTGSGTWSRTPEQLCFFEKEKINEYALLQKRILSNAVHHLKENGLLIYITCSIFKKENEEVVDFIQQELRLKLMTMKLLKGYEIKADTMFLAVMKKSL